LDHEFVGGAGRERQQLKRVSFQFLNDLGRQFISSFVDGVFAGVFGPLPDQVYGVGGDHEAFEGTEVASLAD